MQFAMHESDASDGRLFDVGLFTQRIVPLAGERVGADADEVLYVLEGSGRATLGGETHPLQPGTAVFVGRGTAWSAEGEGRAVSVLVHDPDRPSATHAVLDLTAGREGTPPPPGRQFVLGARPETGCASVTQFIGLVPPGRAPDHFHTYDEVIYILDGEGALHIDGESAPLRPGSCVHLPARVVHCLENTGDSELRLLGVFRPAGSPAEAYYPDGTLAVLHGGVRDAENRAVRRRGLGRERRPWARPSDGRDGSVQRAAVLACRRASARARARRARKSYSQLRTPAA